MSVSHSHQSSSMIPLQNQGGTSRRRGVLRLACLTSLMTAVLLSSISGTVFGDEDPASGSGVNLRVGHIEGQGVPQVRPITPVEIFPYLLIDKSLLFSDVRLFLTNDATFGGNAGLGYRYYDTGMDRIFGISGWYDGDNTRTVLFQQLGLSVESLGGPLDLRGNFYLPVGTRSRDQSVDLIDGSLRFQGNNIVYEQNRRFFTAMQGFDAEAGVPIPSEFAADHSIRLFGGGYHFTGDGVNSITGASARLQANIFSGLDAQIQVMHDNYFKTRAFVGVSWTFGPMHSSQRSQETTFGRIGEHVNRNYTVLAPVQERVEHVPAVDPNTGNPYQVAHVDSAAAGGGDGTVGNPFQTITAAQGTGRNIIFVHAGSVLNGADAAVVLQQNTRVLGDAPNVTHFIQVPELGRVIMPHGPTTGNLPVLSGAPGNSVVLASGGEFSGFTILNPAGNGILGDGVQNITMHDVSVNGAGLAGMRFSNTFNNISLSNAVILNSPTGIDVSTGAGALNFLGTTAISNSTGTSVLIHDLASAGSVNFNNLVVDHRGGMGMQINNAAGVVTVSGTATFYNNLASVLPALDIRNSSGQFAFNRANITDTTGGPGFILQNNTGLSSFGTLNILSQSGPALMADNGGTLHVNPTVAGSAVDPALGGNINALNGSALDIQTTSLNANFTSVSSNNAVNGIRLVNNTGSLAVLGNGTAGSGGTIQNATTGIYLQNAGTTQFQGMLLTGNGTGVRANHGGNVSLLNTTIQNSTGYGVDSLDTAAFYIGNSLFTGNAGGNIRGTYDEQGSYAFSLVGNSLSSDAANNVVFTSLAGSEGSSLNLLAQGNTYFNTVGSTTGLAVNWNGTLAANVSESNFVGSGGSFTGAYLQNASTTQLSTIVLNNNSYLGTGGNDTGFRVETAGSAQATLVNNTVQLNGTNSTGFRMSYGAASQVNVSSNQVINTTDGATGIYFDSVVGGGQYRIENNLINLANSGGMLDRGIFFSIVPDVITLIGSPQTNNTVLNANTPFFAPPGSTGFSRIWVNGAPVP